MSTYILTFLYREMVGLPKKKKKETKKISMIVINIYFKRYALNNGKWNRNKLN